ncbi:MAG: UDP-N-acetylmuramate--L-alanine ligase [Candidatus Kaiserbacteria bacterium]|nr:UDP-N-acetylmuramate--L-alanine ligase [Candidatus Kaiserbacteria bacterium]
MEIPENIYMIGVGGIGMSALAQLLVHQGKNVTGSDREESPPTALLASKGVQIMIGQDPCNIPANVQLIIYSDAIYPDNVERVRGVEMNIPEISYFDALGIISKNMRTIAVAGTHGKTTTTGMLTKILQHAGMQPTAIIGSIVKDFGSNFLAGDPNLFVVEACEYRDHMLKLSPEVLVITNIELDHTDYFPTLEAIQKSFKMAIDRVPAHGFIITDTNNPNIRPLLEDAVATVVDYSLASVPTLPMLGEFNNMNARAAKVAAAEVFPLISEDILDEALTNFKGSWRRFEYKGETVNGALVYDDYAHHPTAITKTIEAARERFPAMRIVVAFHPHLYSRTQSLLPEFADALGKADTTIIAPIYAAREVHDPSVSNHILAELANETEGGTVIALDTFDEIRDELLKEKEGTLIITIGAGDIYKVAEQIVAL